MCRKDFTGYMCGHCTVPTITPCPLTLSNPRFPLCKFIADFPSRTETYCDPCQRVSFTQDVLLKEKIHMEEHKLKRCLCGNDFTEEERQARAQFLAEKKRDDGFKEVTRSVNEKRWETYRPRKFDQGNYPQFNDKKGIGHQQQVSQHMGHLEQYLNAPYGRHPMQPQMQASMQPSMQSPVQPSIQSPMRPSMQPQMQPVPTQQQFHLYQPRHGFISVGVPSMNRFPGIQSIHPFVNGGYFTTESMFTFAQPFAGTGKAETAQDPDSYSARDQPAQELKTEIERLSMAKGSYADSVECSTSPAVISSGTFQPRNHAPKKEV